MSNTTHLNGFNKGFTLIELILSMAIFAILSGFVVITLIRPQTQASVVTTTTTMVSELRQQQIKAMVGETENASTAQTFGIYFEPNAYILFRGSTYSAGDTNNFRIPLDTNLTVVTTFPSSQIIFSKRSGEIQNFVSGQNTITLTNSAGGEQKTITINRYGVADVL